LRNSKGGMEVLLETESRKENLVGTRNPCHDGPSPITKQFCSSKKSFLFLSSRKSKRSLQSNLRKKEIGHPDQRNLLMRWKDEKVFVRKFMILIVRTNLTKL